PQGFAVDSAADGDVASEPALAAVLGVAVTAGAAAVIGSTIGLRQTGLLTAHRPGARSLLLEDLLGNADLFLLAVLIGRTGSTEAGPGLLRELQAAVVAVSGVDVPVAAGLTLGDLVPDASLGCLSRCAGAQTGQARCGNRTGTDEQGDLAKACAVEVHCVISQVRLHFGSVTRPLPSCYIP